jgi:hypothetical protein
MDVAALVVAIVAALIGVGSLGWQFYTWWHERRLNITVDLDEVTVHDEPDMPEVSTTIFRITVINRSSFPVRVTGATLVPAGERVRSFTVGKAIGLPREVTPRDAEDIELPVGMFIGELPDTLVEAWVRLSTGEEFRSVPTSFRTRFGGSPSE